ncbi:MAG: orotidine 5'-phosphate decarboxylase [Candidatus Aenigmarchaeota archaeon]|nr:orotidine 5'-phosphate decarboxylase [Candidatus Aenigmarchaeota archaeon]
MMFKKLWLETVERKNSILCAGLDPADTEMKRGPESLPAGVKKYDWTMKYIEMVAPYCAGLKFNINYWKGLTDIEHYGEQEGKSDPEILKKALNLARDRELVIIEDSKLPDIGATNDAGMYYAERADAVTVAPFAGNLGEMSEQAKKRNLGIITMCIMSNPEYEIEKNKLVPIPESERVGIYPEIDVISINGQNYVKQYLWLAYKTKQFDVPGAVIGAPSAKNHVKEEEVQKASIYLKNKGILIPGIGKQGGEANILFKYFPSEDCIANVGRALMFPENGDQEAAAKYYFGMLNDLRAKK